jgi:hypothetical protein
MDGAWLFSETDSAYFARLPNARSWKQLKDLMSAPLDLKGVSNEADVHLRGGRTGDLADHCAGATGSAIEAEVRIARGDSGVEHSARSEAGLLSTPGAGAEADLLEASPLCARLRQARDG